MPMTGVSLQQLLGLVDSFQLAVASFLAPASPGPPDFVNGVRKLDFIAEGEVEGTVLKVRPGSGTDQGLFIPWLTQQQNPGNQNYMDLGSFTRPIATGDPFSWVVTGPFTGCHPTVYRSGTTYTFCHLVTGNTSQPIATQQQGIAAAVPGATLHHQAHNSPAVALGNAEGYTFWYRLRGGHWYQRTLWIQKSLPPCRIVQLEAEVAL